MKVRSKAISKNFRSHKKFYGKKRKTPLIRKFKKSLKLMSNKRRKRMIFKTIKKVRTEAKTDTETKGDESTIDALIQSLNFLQL